VRVLSRRDRHPFLDRPPPIAIAHRGGAREGPENTLEAFGAAAKLGYLYLETDAHVTRDGVVVACHDAALDRVTDLTGAIAQLSVAEVEAADAGYRFSTDGGGTFPFRGHEVCVPRFDELLRRWPQARFIVDPKDDASVAPLAAVIESAGAWDRVCLGSFSDRRLRRIRKLAGGRACTSMGPVATLVSCVTAALFGRMPRLGADCVQVPIRMGPIRIVTPRWVRAAHRAGLPVHVWTIDDVPTMHRLLDLGVDGIMTDRPSVLLEVLAARGTPVPGTLPA
jgi:glycerophosphoryl diester phosphodiesterase